MVGKLSMVILCLCTLFYYLYFILYSIVNLILNYCFLFNAVYAPLNMAYIFLMYKKFT